MAYETYEFFWSVNLELEARIFAHMQTELNDRI